MFEEIILLKAMNLAHYFETMIFVPFFPNPSPSSHPTFSSMWVEVELEFKKKSPKNPDFTTVG